MSCGYGYSKEYKDKEIAEVLGLTSERVRQLRHGAKTKLAAAYMAAVK
jgi:DNA-directed RNA polymerase specialized sigma24 family protein